MTKQEAIKKITEYLKSHNIQYIMGLDEGCMQITIVYNVKNAPNKCVESCIWFYGDGMEARIYYSALGAEVCKNSEHINSLLRVLNFINARVFLSCFDGSGSSLYEPHILYTPRIYLTEDDYFDITITTMINYDFLKIAPIETADYLTAYCPELLDRLSPAIFGVLIGQITSDEAITYIKEFILSEAEIKDERRVYLDYLINVYAKKFIPDTKQEESDAGAYSHKLEYVSESKSVLGQKYLGNYLPIYDEESRLWCVQTSHGFEYGSIDYVAAEFSGSGLIYHFKENGEIGHVHGFEAVLERLIGSGGNLEIMEEYGEYSVKERQFIKSVRNALNFVRQRQRPMTGMELRENGKYSACEEEQTSMPRYLLLVTAAWNHDADEWIGIYSDNDELRNAYEKSLSEFEIMRQEGYYCDAQYLAIVEFAARGSKEHEHNGSYSDFSYKQRFREVKPEELHCFKKNNE